jgi:hypothetical protein
MGLSNAERQRRYVTRLKAQAKAGGGGDDVLKAELAAAKARICDLEDENAALRAVLAHPPS